MARLPLPPIDPLVTDSRRHQHGIFAGPQLGDDDHLQLEGTLAARSRGQAGSGGSREPALFDQSAEFHPGPRYALYGHRQHT